MSLLSVAARTVTDWMKLGFPESVAKRIVAGGVAATAATQSDDAEAGFVTRGGKTLLEAWHGSPHKFDKFSMDAIGTGEGAQAYGHGLYFADSEDVARGYREALTKSGQDIVDVRLKKADGDIDKAIADAEARAEKYRQGGANSYAESVEEDLRFLRQFKETGQVHDGALYRTEIDVTPESLLDWDKPLSEQPQAVQDSLQWFEFDSDNPSGRDVYHAIVNQKYDYQLAKIDSINKELSRLNSVMEADEVGYRQFRTDAGREAAKRYDELEAERALLSKETTLQASQSAATSELDEFGIKGIKYLDGDSRAAGNGTSNYVIFDDSLINIAERGNADPRLLAGIAAGGGGVSAATALSNKLAAAQAVKERGNIRAPNSGMLHSITMGARDLERRLEGHPAALLFPEGIVKYLEQLNREERPSRETALWALLDMI